MPSMKFIVFYLIFFLIYGLTHYYIGLRGWQAITLSFPSFRPIVPAVIFGLLAAAFPFTRFIDRLAMVPRGISHVITMFSSYWLAIWYYLFITVLLIDLIRWIDRYTAFLPRGFKQYPFGIFLAVLAMITALLVYGTLNTRQVQVRNYDITINKSAGEFTQLNIVMVSDIHLGKIIHLKNLEKMVDMVNDLQPDLVLLPGDIIDEDVDLLSEEKIPEIMGKLSPRFGIFASLGNHEYLSRDQDRVIYYLNRANITVLRDQWVKVDDSFYVVGRDDLMRARLLGTPRKPLSDIIKSDLDHSLPILLMDHQPKNLDEPQQAGIDLQVSGHTHRGQIFPNNFITPLIYEVDWGYKQKGLFHVVVSSGFGTWGPPMRIGSSREIVNIRVKFSGKDI